MTEIRYDSCEGAVEGRTCRDTGSDRRVSTLLQLDAAGATVSIL